VHTPTIHIEPEPYRYAQGPGSTMPESRTLPFRAPSIGPKERGPLRDDDRPYPYRSPSPDYPAPIGVGPGYDRGAGPTVIQPPSTTHLTYPTRSLTGPSPPPTEREGEPLLHPFGQLAQYPPSEQFPVPIGGPVTCPSHAPTVVEVTGPEPIQVYPPPDGRWPLAELARKRCI
jgi:hypothetical protein